MKPFILYPAIDLRAGRVVRLVQGDPSRQTVYGDDPAGIARRWLTAGASWLHVVNLDRAFGEADHQNRAALTAILEEVANASPEAGVQFGGGLRSLEGIQAALDLGVRRVVLGTAAVEDPDLVAAALQRFGHEQIALGLDALDGWVQIRGWKAGSTLAAVELGRQFFKQGLRWAVYTNISRDGAGGGLDVESTRHLATETGLMVIASGGAASLQDLRRAKEAGLSGAILGRALYEGTVDLEEALRWIQ